MKKTNTDYEKTQISILLGEYQACHRTRNHYDSVRWTIGTIFIGTSLGLFGLSASSNIDIVLLSGAFSIGLMFIWYLYAQHVNPYVMESLVRFHEIEIELEKMNFKIEQHRSIYNTNKIVQKPKGTTITYSLFFLVLTIWTIRIGQSLFGEFGHTLDFGISSFILFVVFLSAIYWFNVYHTENNPKIFVNKMEKIELQRDQFRKTKPQYK